MIRVLLLVVAFIGMIASNVSGFTTPSSLSSLTTTKKEVSYSSSSSSQLNFFKTPQNPEEIAMKIIEKINQEEQKTMSDRDSLKVREVFETLRSAPKEGFSGYESENYMNNMAQTIAVTDPQSYCKVNCLENDHCTVFEDLFNMSADEVKQYCSECILESDDEYDECAVPDAVLESPLFKQSLENRHKMELSKKFQHEDRENYIIQIKSKINKYESIIKNERRKASVDKINYDKIILAQEKIKDNTNELSKLIKQHRSYIIHHQDEILNEMIIARQHKINELENNDIPFYKEQYEKLNKRSWWKKIEEGDADEIDAKKRYENLIDELQKYKDMKPPTIDGLLSHYTFGMEKDELDHEKDIAERIHNTKDKSYSSSRISNILKDYTDNKEKGSNNNNNKKEQEEEEGMLMP